MDCVDEYRAESQARADREARPGSPGAPEDQLPRYLGALYEGRQGRSGPARGVCLRGGEYRYGVGTHTQHPGQQDPVIDVEDPHTPLRLQVKPKAPTTGFVDEGGGSDPGTWPPSSRACSPCCRCGSGASSG
jgi:hypothetical protein